MAHIQKGEQARQRDEEARRAAEWPARMTIETSVQALRIVEQMRSLHAALALEGLRRMPTNVVRDFLTRELPGFRRSFCDQLRAQILTLIDPCAAQAIGKIDVCRVDVLPLILDPRFPNLATRRKLPPLAEDALPCMLALDVALGDSIEFGSPNLPGAHYTATVWGAGEGRIVRVDEASGMHTLVRACPADLLVRLDLFPKPKGKPQ